MFDLCTGISYMPDLCTGISYIEALDFGISLIHVLESRTFIGGNNHPMDIFSQYTKLCIFFTEFDITDKC